MVKFITEYKTRFQHRVSHPRGLHPDIDFDEQYSYKLPGKAVLVLEGVKHIKKQEYDRCGGDAFKLLIDQTFDQYARDILSEMRDVTDQNYTAYLKSRKDTLSWEAEQWQNFCDDFKEKQEKYLSDWFDKVVKDALKGALEQMKKAVKSSDGPTQTVKISAPMAFGLLVKANPLKFKVTSKFKTDHLLKSANLSKKNSIAEAVERFERNQAITKSSWMLMDESTVLNKVKAASHVAQTYRGKQQLAMQISVTRRTVDIDILTEKQSKQYECIETTIRGKKFYLNCSSQEKDVKINVMGEWNPLTGEVEVYHYDEGAFSTAHVMLDAYLEWIYDPETKTYIRTTAK